MQPLFLLHSWAGLSAHAAVASVERTMIRTNRMAKRPPGSEKGTDLFLAAKNRSVPSFVGEEAPDFHGVLQSTLAHVRLVEEILHDFEQHRGLVGVDEGQVDLRIVVAREYHAHDHGEGVF